MSNTMLIVIIFTYKTKIKMKKQSSLSKFYKKNCLVVKSLDALRTYMNYVISKLYTSEPKTTANNISKNIKQGVATY